MTTMMDDSDGLEFFPLVLDFVLYAMHSCICRLKAYIESRDLDGFWFFLLHQVNRLSVGS